MPAYLCLSIRFLQPYSHGRGEDEEPEWPPSPLRVFQATIAAAAGYWNERQTLVQPVAALRWLESQRCSQIVAAPGTAASVRCQFYVPDNTADLVVSAWKRGELTRQVRRSEKVVCPTLLGGDDLHYLYPLADASCPHFATLQAAARSITHLGWGIDMVVGDLAIVDAEQAHELVPTAKRWLPTDRGGVPLRTPRGGTLDDLMRKHEAFLNRLDEKEGFRPVPPLREFDVVRFRRAEERPALPHVVFELTNTDGTRFAYAQRKLIHIAGMVRHLAIEAMRASPPEEIAEESVAGWIDAYVAGHARNGNAGHRQFSYVPLPSIGHIHTNPAVRRFMLAAPLGDDDLLRHLAIRLDGQVLKPKQGTVLEATSECGEFSDSKLPPALERVESWKHDGVVREYLGEQSHWASVTPVILPGHDDHKPAKTHKLIERALAQSGIEQPCDFEWSPYSQFPKSLSAHKYDRQKRPVGYCRPDHLHNNTAVHLTLRFHDGSPEKRSVEVPGPLLIGSGRHCGFGLMARHPHVDRKTKEQ